MTLEIWQGKKVYMENIIEDYIRKLVEETVKSVIATEIAKVRLQNNIRKQYYTQKELKELFSVSDETIEGWCNAGIIDRVKMGRGWRYEAEQVDRLFDDYRNQNISNEYRAAIAKATKKAQSRQRHSA